MAPNLVPSKKVGNRNDAEQNNRADQDDHNNGACNEEAVEPTPSVPKTDHEMANNYEMETLTEQGVGSARDDG
jgi:hypothetical protein